MATKEKLQCLKDFHKGHPEAVPGRACTWPEDEAEKSRSVEKWASRIDFVPPWPAASAGLGNAWRFPLPLLQKLWR